MTHTTQTHQDTKVRVFTDEWHASRFAKSATRQSRKGVRYEVREVDQNFEVWRVSDQITQ